MAQEPLTADLPERLIVGDVTIDRAAFLVIAYGRPVVMPPREFRLLNLLISRADHVVTNQEILTTIWGAAPHTTSNTLAVHVRRLRRKLAHDGADTHLRTVRGIGYIFDTVPVQQQRTTV